jgi:hypothetical protein
MHGTGLSCSLGRIFHGVGCSVCGWGGVESAGGGGVAAG